MMNVIVSVKLFQDKSCLDRNTHQESLITIWMQNLFLQISTFALEQLFYESTAMLNYNMEIAFLLSDAA
jgi:hypothetical protein